MSENHFKNNAMFLQKTDILTNVINPDISNKRLKMDNNYKAAEKELKSKIMNITLRMNDHYPELSKYLEKMPVNIPVDKKPEITLTILSSYYRSLNVLLNTYIKEHPINSTR